MEHRGIDAETLCRAIRYHDWREFEDKYMYKNNNTHLPANQTIAAICLCLGIPVWTLDYQSPDIFKHVYCKPAKESHSRETPPANTNSGSENPANAPGDRSGGGSEPSPRPMIYEILTRIIIIGLSACVGTAIGILVIGIVEFLKRSFT